MKKHPTIYGRAFQFTVRELVVRQKCDEQLLDLYCAEMLTTRLWVKNDKFAQWRLTPRGKAAIELVVADRWSESSERIAERSFPKSNWPTCTTWQGKKVKFRLG
jgi:hypothetical protein